MIRSLLSRLKRKAGGVIAARFEVRAPSAVYVVDLSDRLEAIGTPVRVSPPGDFSQAMISPDGSRVVFWGIAEGARIPHIWLTDLSSGESHPLTSGEHVHGHPFWFPDNRRIVGFRSADPLWIRERQFDPNRKGSSLIVLDTVSGKKSPVTDSGFVDERPATSPNGEQIVFVSNRSGRLNLWAANSDGSGARQVTDGPGPDYRPVISPDGVRLAFFSPADDGAHQLRLLSWPDCEELTVDSSPCFQWLHGPFWSSDSRTLLVHGPLRGTQQPVLCTVDLVDQSVKPLPILRLNSASHGTWDKAQRLLAFDSPDLAFG